MFVRKLRLLTPGPTPLFPPAIRAMSAPDMHHRTKDFIEVYKSVVADLKYLYGSDNDVAVFCSSGSGAMEAAVSNLFNPGEKVIVCQAGKFGERWTKLAKAFGLEPIVIEQPYGSVVEPEQVEQALKANPDAQGVFVQASETSTGVSHDIEAMGKIVAKTDAIFVIDAITGLGTQPLDIDGWNLDVVIGGSQKAVMIPPGLAFAAVSAKAWEKQKKSCNRYFYFNLKAHAEGGVNGESPFTPATSLMLGLGAALEYIREIGRENMILNAQSLAKATREAALALGLELFAQKNPAGSVTAIKAPEGMDSGKIVKGYRDEFNSIIANGQGTMKGQIFRIAHLGYFDFHDLFATIAELELILSGAGHKVDFGKGVAAVQRVYAEVAKG
ncbi:MAG: alanine--glyoxylate aminotransferase family protein [Acidobacteria bacterium]|nr:alanine--glyoxylate aminotransferase family protein [Acidobacteriota bacterium]